jgi:hypothetical protein
MPMRPKFLVLLGLLASAATVSFAPALSAAGFNVGQPPYARSLSIRVDERSDALCREEARVLATLKKEGASSRPAIEAFGHVARCESVRADIAVILAQMSAAANEERKRAQDEAAKGIGRDSAKRSSDGKAADGNQGNEAKPSGQVRGADDATEADKRRAVDDADKARKAEEDKRRATEEDDRSRRAVEAERSRKAEAERRRKAEEAEERREAAEERRAKERREATRKKLEIRKVETKRKSEPTTKASSRGGVYARCESLVRSKYGMLDPREYQIRLTQCLASGGSL